MSDQAGIVRDFQGCPKGFQCPPTTCLTVAFALSEKRLDNA